jgi:septal ring factor EnvC (AmiA/AmiB activator)
LIQGLSGFKGLLQDIPKLIDNFKSWFRWLDPVEKKIDNIAKDLSGIDPSKLNTTATASATATIDKEDVDNMRQYNVETERQNSFFGQNIDQRKQLEEQLKRQQKAQLKTKKDIEDQLILMKDAKEAYSANVKELTKYINEYNELIIKSKTGSKQEQLLAKMRLNALKEQVGSMEALTEKVRGYDAMVENTTGNIMDLADKQRALNVQIETTQKQLKSITGMKAKVGSFMKSVASTV